MTENNCVNRVNCVTCKVLKLFNDTRNNVTARSPSQLYNALKRANTRFSKLFDGKMQDAHEFLELLAEQMETEAHSLKWSVNFFVADIRTSVQCLMCETTGILGDLTLDVGHKSIQTALDMYFAWESVNDYDYLDVSITGYFEAAFANPGDCKYKLTSVIKHVGRNIYSGHYTTTVCSPDAFYEFDDTTVRRMNENGVKENDAYILFYECTKFLYDEHEVHSGNSSPIWNMVDLTKWDGIEVEVIDDSGPISDLEEQLEEEHLQEEIRLAIAAGEVDSAGNALIIVEFDGSWGKRFNGKSYSSLSGCAAIIGLRTNKILYSDVKSKYCHVCKMAQSRNAPPNQHDCNKNYDGPSSGMETQIIVEGFIHCASKGARFTKYVGDGDSSTYKALRDLHLYKDPELEIEKFECVNHLFRNFWKKFDDLLESTKFCRRGRKLLSSSLGGDICVGVRKAAEYWRNADVDLVEKCSNLERDILNAPLYYLGVHDNCRSYFCDKKTHPTVQNTICILKDTGLFYQIMDLCQNYFANNAKSLIANLCTNKTEGFNSLIAKTLGGKRVCNSLAGSYKSRFHAFAYGDELDSCVKLENSRKRKVKTKTIAKESKPKKIRFTKTPKNKNKGRQKIRYGPGIEDVDISPSAYQTAESRLLDKLRENQINRDTVEIETRGQHLNQKWIVVRKDVLTPSYFGRILNSNSKSLIILNDGKAFLVTFYVLIWVSMCTE
ncbi:hypothetical protein HA402_005955 [Bradysia odoriphaga]|nr:hypothetical protein HA402_005955 [Bradysia odoriphaga]